MTADTATIGGKLTGAVAACGNDSRCYCLKIVARGIA